MLFNLTDEILFHLSLNYNYNTKFPTKKQNRGIEIFPKISEIYQNFI